MNLFDEWKSKRLFRIENDRFKEKKYIHTSPIKIDCEGFNNKNLYPILLSDFLSKYYRMAGFNVMYPIVYNNINDETLSYSKTRGEMFLNLKENYHLELETMAVGFDIEKEISFQDKAFSTFCQNIFYKLYSSGFIRIEKRDVFVDFQGNKIIPDYLVKDLNDPMLRKRNADVAVLSFKDVNILEELKSVNISKDSLDKIYELLDVKTGLKFSISSNLKNIFIDVKLNNPEFMAGITFIALNPKLIDVTKYASEDEYETIIEYSKNFDDSNDCYTGVTLKNPLTNEDVYLFASYKYDEAIHVGIPSINILDHMFSSTLGLNNIEILKDDVLINSDILDGLGVSEAHETIIEAFIGENLGTSYLYTSLDEIVISSFDELGILMPVVYDYKNELSVLNPSFYPIYYTNRYKINITNEDTLDSDLEIAKMTFNDHFINALANIYSFEFDYYGGNNNYFETSSNYKDFKESIAIFKKEEAYYEVFYNVLLNTILKEFNKDYKNYKEIIELDNLEEDYSILEERQRLGISFVDIISKKSNIDAYRLYLFFNDDLSLTLQDTLSDLKRYENIISKIKETYNSGFSDSNFTSNYFSEFKRMQNALIKSRAIKKYARNLIEFFSAYVLTKSINKSEAYEFLIMLSLICPIISEEINKEIYKDTYSIFYSSWPK